MINMKLLTVIIFIILLCGCTGPDDPLVLQKNIDTLKGEGQYIGTLKDGRKVIRFKIDRGNNHDHYIYVIDRSITTNAAITINQGKQTSTINTVQAELE